jgi:Ankyrin repeat
MKLWTSLKPIDIILLSDTLLITTIADSTALISTTTNKPNIVEATIPLATAKIRVTQATASQSGITNTPTVSAATEYNFELLSPNGSYTISVDNSDAYEQWITAIADCIVHTIGYDTDSSNNSSISTAGVRHRVIIGTLYNAAVTGDTIELSKLLKAASDSNTTSILINQKDSAGLCAIDYAVRGAQVNTVSMLVAAGADIATSSAIADTGNGYTLLHYAAAAQHNVLLNILLTHMNSNNSSVSAVNVTDKHGMTPLHVLTTTAKYESDVNTVKQCITALTAAGADIDLPIRDPYVKNSGTSGSTALHTAAIRGQWWLVECLLQCGATVNKGCLLPLTLQSVKLTPVMTRRPSRSKSSDMHSDSVGSTSNSAAVCSDYTALHLACLQCCTQPHSDAVDASITTANTTTESDLPRTIEVLLKWGALPNTTANGSTALELLVAAHSAIKQQQQQQQQLQDDSTSSNSGATVTAVVSLLLRNGARVSQELESKIAAILGSTSAMNACTTAFKNLAPFELSSYSSNSVHILNEDAWSSADSDSSKATCALCDAGFTLLRRRHHCRYLIHQSKEVHIIRTCSSCNLDACNCGYVLIYRAFVVSNHIEVKRLYNMLLLRKL